VDFQLNEQRKFMIASVRDLARAFYGDAIVN